MDTELPDTPEEPNSPGTRLRAYIDARWTRRRNRGIRGLAEELNTTPETMYTWFNDVAEPGLDYIARMAKTFGVEYTRSHA